ncbi:toxic anion resistance protein [Lysinibacillus piscis]|uniref:Toxic anion resistance protein n=1 Tax=Lysinibacillus piscis TaxID=2518931 RepID=A0ABQ5NL89_9BACI|nr:toxic anion resistance protein [Lysinibacillus sp. KH24]GLC89127.1 toxic anion resistance protein [Lysinibacillus sp. KH24]
MTTNDYGWQLQTLQGVSPLVQMYLTADKTEAMATYNTLSPFAQSQALVYAGQLQMDSFDSILTLGQHTQRGLSQFADRMLAQVKQKDVTKIGQMLDSLMQTLDRVDPTVLEPKKQTLMQKWFGSKTAPTIKQTLTEFERISIQVERIGVQLERAQLQLLQDIEFLEELYTQNHAFFEELATAIAAGQMKKHQVIEAELPAKITHAQTAQQALAVQQLNDFVAQLERLDQRIYDLQISQQVALQSAPQIRMIQQANQTLAEKIQFSIVTLIPLWKSQLAMMLSMQMDHHYTQLEERLSQANERLTNPAFQQQVATFKATQLELQAAIQDVATLHQRTEQEKQQLLKKG